MRSPSLPSRPTSGWPPAALERASAALRAGDAAAAAAEATAALALWRGEPGAELGEHPARRRAAAPAAALRDDLLLIRARARRAAATMPARSPTSSADRAATAGREPAAGAAPHPGRGRAPQRGPARLRRAEGGAARPAGDASRPGARRPERRLLAADEEERPSAPRRVRIGLRSAPNALVGREYDLEAVEDLVATSRLTTILGAGGLGKTRLAQEVGNRAVHTPAVDRGRTRQRPHR